MDRNYGAVGVAIVGAGYAGQEHEGALRRLGVEVGGWVGSSPERARQELIGIGLLS